MAFTLHQQWAYKNMIVAGGIGHVPAHPAGILGIGFTGEAQGFQD